MYSCQAAATWCIINKPIRKKGLFVTFKAAFFDRDNTLVYRDKSIRNKRSELIRAWSGRDDALSYEQSMALFDMAGYPDKFFYEHRNDEDICIKEEYLFWQRYNECYLKLLGVNDNVAERAAILNEMSWLKGIIAYPETVKTLDWFRAKGYKLGVISDTSPSLRLTIKQAGLDEYFDSYTCSAFAGVDKPDPKIFNMALESLGVSAAESLYVDDYYVEADGARNMGFTAFHIIRDGYDKGYEGERKWDIYSLYEMAEYAGRENT